MGLVSNKYPSVKGHISNHLERGSHDSLKKGSRDPNDLTTAQGTIFFFWARCSSGWYLHNFRRVSEDTDYLDPFHPGFRPDFGMETTLVTDYPHQDSDRQCASLLILSDLSATLD